MNQEDRDKVTITRMVNKIIAFQDKKQIQGGCHYFSLYLYYWIQKKYKIILSPIIGQLQSIEDGEILGNHTWLEFDNSQIDPTAYFINGCASGERGDLILFDKIIRKGTLSYNYITESDGLDTSKLNAESIRTHQLIRENNINNIVEYLKGAPGALFSQTRKSLS